MESTLTPPISAPLAPVVGIWDDGGTFTKYRVTLTFVDKVMGGVPQDPNIIEGWLRKKFTGDGDAEIRAAMFRTLDELGVDVDTEMTMEQLYEVAKRAAATQKGNTFFRDEFGLYLSAFQVKAMFKECTNIQFAGERWGTTKKGPKNYLAERVFVDDHRVYLGRDEPDGTHLQIGQVTGPKGPRSTLTYYDYALGASASFVVSSLHDCITPAQWREILVLGQKIGLGAIRSLGHGQFRVTAFDRL